MLGRLRQTTRTDVSLALVMAGFVYLAWALVCWSAKGTAVNLQAALAASDAQTAEASVLARSLVATFGSWTRTIFDIAGPICMFWSLWMVIRASRQRRIISWSWLIITCQGLAAVLISVWASLAQVDMVAASATAPVTIFHGDWSPFVIATAVLIWFCTLIWLLLQRAFLRRLLTGPAVRDGVKTHAYRR